MTHPDAAFFGELLDTHTSHVYGKSSVDFMGTPTESLDVEVKGRFSWYKRNRARSSQGEEVSKVAEFVTFDDYKVHESDRVTIEGVLGEDGMTLRSFEVVSVSIYQDEYGNYHHQTFNLR